MVHIVTLAAAQVMEFIVEAELLGRVKVLAATQVVEGIPDAETPGGAVVLATAKGVEGIFVAELHGGVKVLAGGSLDGVAVVEDAPCLDADGEAEDLAVDGDGLRSGDW